MQHFPNIQETTLDSREVAEMVGKPHDQLMRSIRTYAEYLDSAKMQTHDFFIESTYQNSQNKTQPSYLVTRKGCDMIANKMTGQKGTLFTAAYINRFHQMETGGFNIPKTLPDALRLAADLAEKNGLLEQTIGKLQPKADHCDFVLQNPGLTKTTIS